jgi:hypothetical protein
MKSNELALYRQSKTHAGELEQIVLHFAAFSKNRFPRGNGGTEDLTSKP